MWLIFALLSAFFFALYVVLARVYSVDVIHARAYGIVWAICAGVLLLPFVLYSLTQWDVSSVPQAAFTTLAISICFYALYDRTQFAVRKYLEASHAALLSQITPVCSVLTLWLLAQEQLTPGRMVAMSFIVIGNGIVSEGGWSGWKKQGVLLGLFSFGSLGVAFALDKIASTTFPVPVYAFCVYLLPALFNALIPPISPVILRKQAQGTLGKLFLLAATNVLGAVFYLLAFKTGEGGPVIMIVSSSLIIAVLMSIVFLREQTYLLRKGIAAVLVALGTYLLI